MAKQKLAGIKFENKQSIKRILSNNLYILRYAVKYTPAYLAIACLFTIYSEIEVFFEFAYCTKYMIDLIQYNGDFSNAVMYILIISSAIIFKIAFSAVFTQYIRPKAKEKLHRNMQMELFEKAAEIDLSCYDDPEYYNEFVWSISEANNRVDEAIDHLCKLSGSIATIIATGTFFIVLDKLGLIFVLFTFISTLVINLALGKLKYKVDAELKPIQRKRSYINRVFYLNNYAKEIRLNNVANKLKKDFDSSNKEILSTIDRYSKKQIILGFLCNYVFNSFILDGLYVIYLLFVSVVKKSLSYGSMISLFNTSWSLKSKLQSISEIIPKLQQNSLYIERMRTFMDYKVVIRDGENPMPVPVEPTSIELKNVSFSYNEKSGKILKNISLTIKPYEKIALVGYNGAGKTTLTKLLMRLYDVSEGEILLNNKNIKDYKVQEYRSSFGTVFQDYQMFAASIGENVVMDELMENKEEDILNAIENSGFLQRLTSLNKGIYTPLTREFDEAGVNLSGGEAQKVAIARVFAKQCQTIILDEPSSALDPISEYNLNKTMLEAAKNKTVIFISHRLSSTRLADRIYMLEKGEIIEQGTHEELMELDGKYAEMFNLQAEKYRSQVDGFKVYVSPNKELGIV
jgi:ATP-binding cassette subfamily B protein